MIVDAYQIPYIPFHLTTQEFFQLVHDHLTGHGVVMVNTLRIRESPQLLDALCETLKSVFADVYILELFRKGQHSGKDMGNSLIFASKPATSIVNVETNLERVGRDDSIANLTRMDRYAFRRLVQNAIRLVREYEGGGRLLTDNDAPVEWLVHESIWRYLVAEKS